MKKLEGFDELNENGNFKPLPVGAYVVQINNVVDHPDKEWLEIYFDVAEGEHIKHFANLMAQNGGIDKSRTLRSYSTKSLKFFKRFITSVTKSNPGFTWNWEEKQLIGKKLVAVYGEEEYIYTNEDGTKECRTSCKVVEWHSIQALREHTIEMPQKKLLNEQQKLEIENSKKSVEAPIKNEDLPF